MSKPRYKLERSNPYAQSPCDGCAFEDKRCPRGKGGVVICNWMTQKLSPNHIFVQVKGGE